MLKLDFVKNSFELVEKSTTNFDVYPNPANETINIHFNNKASINLVLRDQAGRAIKEWNGMQKGETISLKGLKAGSYFLLEEGTSSVIKLIKY